MKLGQSAHPEIEPVYFLLCDLVESMGDGGNVRHDVLSGAGIGTLGRGHQSGIDGAEHPRWLEDVRAASKVLNRFTVRAFQK